MEVEMDLTNESTMSLFQELEEVEEVKEEETTTNSSLLFNLINQCGIPLEEQQEKITTPSSPSHSMKSDMETHQSLIEELEEFFGSPTNIDSEQGSRGLDLVTKTSVAAKSPNSILDALASGEVYNMSQDQDFTLTEEVLQGAVSTTCVTEDGQNVIIIVAPPSPAHSNVYTSDTDPEWVPSPTSSVSPSSPLRTISSESRAVKKKYQRKKPQNRTAAFRYREKKKGEQNTVEEELELLAT